MARGWIAGLLTGAVVTALGLGVVSLVMGPVAPMPEPAEVEQAPVEQAPVEQAQTEPAQTEPAEAAAPMAQTEPPATAGDSEAPQPDRAAPNVEAASAEPEPAQVEPKQAEPKQAETPQAETPQPEPDQIAPAQGETAAQSESQTMASADAQVPDQTPAPQAAPPAMAPAAPQEDAGATMSMVDGAAPEVMPEPATAPDATSEAEPAALPEIIVEPEPVAPAPTPGIGNVIVTPEADIAPEAEASPGQTVVTNRLPSIGAAPATAPVVAPEPALSRNALAFAPQGDQPRLAFLLLDTGAEDRAGLGDLGKLPFPVTVSIDASAPDAEAALAFYRDQGAEVMLIVPLPDGATPADVDVTIEAYKPLLAQAIGVLTEENAGFQTLGAGAVQLATNLAETGHGLVTWPAGLNTGYKAALKEGVKAGLVFRDLDGAGQEGAVIRRFLDNAAFKARNQDGVIVVARTRPKTLQALLEWSLGTRAQSVALVPVSVILAGAPTTP